MIKLLNVDYDVRLHSHDVKYGTGSGQQSITGTELKEDNNSHWTIVNVTNASYQRGLVNFKFSSFSSIVQQFDFNFVSICLK